MKQHTILLVACLMTVPAVVAEDAGPCDDGSCPPPPASDPSMGPDMDPETRTPDDCPLLTYWYQPASLPSQPPVGADLNTHCIGVL